jgi:hypothetical protein
LAHQPIEYDAGVTLLPGHYTIKFLARDDETGRIGTFQTSFYIPNLNKVTTQIPISSVVLSSQRLSTTDALYNTVRGKQAAKNDASDPLVQDGQKIIPSVTRVFKADKDLYVFLQAYAAPSGQTAPAATPPQKEPLVGYVSLYSEGQLVFTSKSLAVTPLMTTRLGVTPFMFTLPLGTLKAATYECQVTLLDAEQHRVAFWQGPLRVVQ